MRVRDLMTPTPATCSHKDSLREVARLMREHDCGAIPVLENDRLVGVVTDRDVTVRLVADGRNPLDHTASDAMTSPVVTVGPDDDVDLALRKMKDEQVRRVVVVDDGGVVGIVAQADVARYLPDVRTGAVVERVSEATHHASGAART